MSSVVLRFLCVSVLLAAGCTAREPSADAFTFAIIGDAPYKRREEPHFERMMERIDREGVAFTIHVGDIGAGDAACSDAYYEKTRRQLERSRAPLIYTPGDNEWTDCGRKWDSLERLARLREVFFADEYSLGLTKLRTEVQDDRSPGCGAYPENRAWSRSGIRFATIDVPGSDNNVGKDARQDEEAKCRDEANRRWVERSVLAAQQPGIRALVIAMQANPWRTKHKVYAPTLATIEGAARKLGKPVLLVHGDTHNYRVDQPFTDALGAPVPNLTRVETWGSPVVGWVKVTVDPEGPKLFSFEEHIQGIAP